MNRIFLLLLASLLSFGLYARPNKTAVVKGKIANATTDSIKLSYVKDWVDFGYNTIGAKLGDDGSFSITVPVPEDYLLAIIEHGEQYTELFVEPGYELNMAADAQKFDSTVHYTGKGSELAGYMAKHTKDRGVMMSIYREVQPLFILEPDSFLTALHEVLQKEQAYLETNGKGLPASFKDYWNNYYTYLGYYMMLSYPRFHEVAKTRSYNIGVIPAENYAVSDKVPAAFNDALLPVATYRNFADNYYDAKISPEYVKAEIAAGKPMPSVEKEAKENMPPGTLEYFLASMHYRYIRHIPVDSSEKNIAAFKKQFPGSKYIALLETNFAKRKSMSAGQPAVDLDLVTAEGKKIKLSDFKGKVVYVDFWASWCGPCIREMPASKQVKEHFAGKDVVFLYISIDDNEENWKAAMEKYEIKGVHTREAGGWQAPAAQKYGVQSIPAYFLVDKKGRFALENVPRPSDTEALIAEIEKLL